MHVLGDGDEVSGVLAGVSRELEVRGDVGGPEVDHLGVRASWGGGGGIWRASKNTRAKIYSQELIFYLNSTSAVSYLHPA